MISLFKQPKLWALFRAACRVAFAGGVLMFAPGGEASLMANPGIEAVLAKGIDKRKPVGPTSNFNRDSKVIYGYWKSGKLAPDTIVRTVWIAIDVGGAAPPNTKIIEKTARAADDPLAKHASWWDGVFFITRPTNGWPIGKYRAEIYFNNKLIKTLPFTIM